ncbi:30S ribosomal protein S20 [soil metagenome]
MPNIKSAIKRVEVAERNRQRNKSWKSAVRTVRNEVAESVKAGDPTKASTALHKAYQVIDKAVTKGILHKNSAARKKSRMATEVLKLSSKSA